MIKLPSLMLALVALPLCVASPTWAAADFFLEIDGIEGESVDAHHANTIEIQSFSWGMSNPTTVGGGGTSTGKVSFQDFHFTRSLDKSSPQLAMACATGQHIKSAKLFVRKSGGGSNDYYVITLTDILVTGLNATTSPGASAPTESFSLNFAKIEWRYVPQNADGTAGTPVTAGWDLATGTRI